MKILPTIIICLLLQFPCLSFSKQFSISGYVYEDTNHNGKFDEADKPLADVGVSDGQQVVLTDKSGFYTLEVGEDVVVFVIKPTGYLYPNSQHYLPQFYHIHKPKGSPPDLKYRGVSPTPTHNTVNFPLIKDVSDQDDFSVFVLSDPQAYNEIYFEYFDKDVVSELIETSSEISFGITLGDMVGGDNLDLFSNYIKSISAIKLPWYNVLGNHDMNMDVEYDHLTDETFEATFGPANYSFNHGQVHFIVMDNILFPDPRGDKYRIGGYWVGFREDQLRFLANNLKYVDNDKLIVLAMHSPLDGGVVHSGGNSFRESDRQQLFRLLENHDNILVLAGHTHTQSNNFYGELHGWRGERDLHEFNVGAASGGWYTGKLKENGVPMGMMTDGTPKGYSVVSFSSNHYEISYKAVGYDKSHQIGLYLPKVIPYNANTHANIYANFYIGSPRDSVYFRIDNGKWLPMRHSVESDPIYLDLMYEWDRSETLLKGTRPFDASPCTHLWRAKFPRGLSSGTHRVEIKAIDLYGNVHGQVGVFRVEE